VYTDLAMSRSNPRLDGARQIYFRLTHPQHADLARNIEKVEQAWARARRVLASVGGICHCGKRWGHLMDGVEVTLLDRSPYTARCWDDDRIWINLPLFGGEANGVDALVHEFGHRVWFQCLSDEQQARWGKSWNEIKKRPTPQWSGQCSGTVSGYACTSDLEDFAEVFLAVVRGRVDDHNWKRWVDVCGCGKGASCDRPPHTRSASRKEDDASADGRTHKHGDMVSASPLRWRKYPGGRAKLAQLPGGKPYAKSEDGRFIIWVSRYRRAAQGDAHYFSAVDYATPSGKKSHAIVPIRSATDSTSSLEQVIAAVERWRGEHPV